MTTPATAPSRFTVTRTKSLWRVTFNHPPINLIDPTMVVELHELLTEIEQNTSIIARALEHGFQLRSDLELNFGAYIASQESEGSECNK